MNYTQRLLGQLRRAVTDYKMISDGDKIAVGISGGKDSMTLLAALARYRAFSPERFDLYAINIDMGFPETDPEEAAAIAAFCTGIGVPLTVEKTQIAQIVFDVRKEPNPCSLCSKMRRGALNSAAAKSGCNKVALGHHADDVLETFYLSMLFEGRLSTFSPVTYLDRMRLGVIRPMIYVGESEIIGAVRELALPVMKNPCPADKHTKRQKVKELVRDLNADFKDSRELVLSAIYHPERNNLWKP